MQINQLTFQLRRLAQNATALANELEAEAAGVTVGADERPAKIEKLKAVIAQDCGELGTGNAGVLPVKSTIPIPENRAVLDSLFSKSGS